MKIEKQFRCYASGTKMGGYVILVRTLQENYFLLLWELGGKKFMSTLVLKFSLDLDFNGFLLHKNKLNCLLLHYT